MFELSIHVFNQPEGVHCIRSRKSIRPTTPLPFTIPTLPPRPAHPTPARFVRRVRAYTSHWLELNDADQ